MKQLSSISSVLLLLSTILCQAAQTPTNLNVTEVGYMSILLEWTPHGEFGDIQLIERKGPGDSDYVELLKLPPDAWRYKDLGLEDDSFYQYRIKSISPESESSYAFAEQKTTVNPHTTVFNVKNFGATGNGSTNDTAAIRNAITAATDAGGGIVYFPTGTYAVCPDEDDPTNTVIFRVLGSNLTLKGDGPENSIISCYSPGLQDPEVAWGLDSNGEIRRGSAFCLDYNVSIKQTNVVFDGLRVTGNTRPTGDTNWWTNEQRANGWDIFHKGIYLGAGNDNIFINNCIWDNWRGEIIYSGDPNMKKVKIVDTKVYGTNSSAISTSADFECDNIEVWDAANACIESAFYYNLNGNETGTQTGIFKNSIFEPRRLMLVDTDANPLLLYTDRGKFGAAVFNSEGSSLTFQGCTFKNAFFAGTYFAVAQHDTLITGNLFDNTGIQGYITFDPHSKSDYQMTGGVYDVLISENTFHSSQSSSIILNTAIYGGYPMENVHFRNNNISIDGGSCMIFHDSYAFESGRVNFVIEDNVITLASEAYLSRFSYDVSSAGTPAIAPLWRNNTYPMTYKNEPGNSINLYSQLTEPLELTLHAPYKKLNDFPYPTELSLAKYMDRYPEGFEINFWRTLDKQDPYFTPQPTWNDLSYEIHLDYRDTMKMVKENGIFKAISKNGNPFLKFTAKKVSIAHNESTEDTLSIFDYTGLEPGEIGYIYLSGRNITLSNSMLTTANGEDVSYGEIDGVVEFKVMRSTENEQLIELDRTICDRVIESI